MDPYGSYHNFDDAVLAIGYRVLVMFPRGDRSLGVIMGGSRQYSAGPQQQSDGFYWKHRFNEVETGVDMHGFWKVISDAGPFMSVTKTQVILNDSGTESIILDKAANTLTVNSTTLKIIATGDANITVGGNLTSDVTGDATVTAGGTATVKGTKIILNKQGSGITTANSHAGVVDLITGVAVLPSETTYGDV
jgi:hypothetical protein